MAAILRNGKKGVSLAYVIIAAMVLLVLSGVLAAAAGRNMGLTAVSTQSRQAYLTVKSAVEFAKGEAYRRAQAGEPDDFSVRPDGSLFKAGEAKGKPDGKTVYALCTMKADGLVTVSGKVSYGNAGRSRSLGCSFRLTEDEEPVSGVGAVNGFVAVGGAYGGNKFMNGEAQFGPYGKSEYPVLLKKPIQISGSSNALEAPSIFFMGGESSGTTLDFSVSDAELSLQTEFVYISGTVNGKKDGGNQTKRSQFHLTGKRDNRDSDSFIYVWFENATVNLENVGKKTLNGLYRFPESGADLFDFASYPTPVDGSEWDLYRYYSGVVSYFKQEKTNMLSGASQNGGIDWSTDGKFSRSPSQRNGRDVFLYGDSLYDDDNYHSDPNTSVKYTARSIVFQYIGTKDEPFIVPKVTFQADTLWLNGQSEDGPPDADNDGDDVFAVRQDSSVSKFIFKSSDGQKPVTLYLPHGMSVRNSGGNELYALGTGTYEVKSGTDIFKLNEASQKDAFTKISDKIGGGSGGGSGGSDGVTAGDLKYTDS